MVVAGRSQADILSSIKAAFANRQLPDLESGAMAYMMSKSLRVQPDGKVLITDGPYLETKEHIGGFWVLEAANLDDALAWGRKAVVACRAPVEVRPFGEPTEATERKSYG